MTISMNRVRHTRTPRIDLADIHLADNVDAYVDVRNEPDNLAKQWHRILNGQSIVRSIFLRGYELNNPGEMYETLEQAHRILQGAPLDDVQRPMTRTPTRTDTMSRKREP